MMFSYKIFLNGLAVGISLIMAIGMQNAFVLKQALLKNHVFTIAILCSIIDAFLIFLGVNGFSVFLFQYKIIETLFQVGGVIFLLAYGSKAFYNSFKSQKMDLSKDGKVASLKQIVTTLLIVTLLNPHTYLDNCVVMASIASNYSSEERFSFSIGAILASFIWFFSLSYGAGFFSKYFQQEKAWQILDFIIGIIMYAIAFSLIFTFKL